MIASRFSRRDFVIATSALAGGMTQIPMLIAEELQCDWAKIRAEPVSFSRNAREGDLYVKQSGTWSTFAGGGHDPEVIATVPLHILTGQFRGPGYNTHCFIIESFIDECAARARDGGASFHRGTHKAWRSETGAWRASHVKVRRSLQ